MPNQKQKLERLIRAADEKSKSPPSDPFADLARSILHGVDPVLFAKEALGFTPDAWQERALRCGKDQIILNVSRQGGKSDTVALKALHRALFYRKSMVLIVSPSERQSTEMLRKVQDHLEKLAIKPKMLEDNKLSLEFANKSRIIALPASGGKIRGFSAVDLLIEDEAGEVPDDLHETIRPMLQVSKGQMFLMGTPKGPKGHFATIWHDEGDDWERIRSTAWDNPRVSKDWLERERSAKERMGRLYWFMQEYECAFIATGSGLVYPYDPKANACPALPRDPRLGWQYVLGIDYGFTDSTAFVILGWQKDDPRVYVIESFKKKGLTPSAAAEVAHGLTKKYPFARIVADAGGLGKGYVEEARRRFRLPIERADKNNKRGYIELFVGDLKSKYLAVFPGNEALIAEWNALPWDEEREMPEDGYEDHLADACLYAWRATYHFLEEIRREGPKPGSPEALELEAEQMFEERLQAVQRKDDVAWWDQGDAQWADDGRATWMN